MKSICSVLSMVVVTCCLWSTAVLAEEITIGGGGAPMDNILNPVKVPFEKATGVKLKLALGSATISFRSLSRNEIDGLAVGISYEGLLDALKKEQTPVSDPSEYQVQTIGKGLIHVVVNKENPVTKLSKEQIKGIFTGKIVNWKDVGGKDSPIMVTLSTTNPATNGSFRILALDGEAFTKDVLEAGPFEEIRQNVAANPEAIGFGPYTVLDSSVKEPEVPEISRDINLITKGTPSAAVQKLVAFIKGEGQRYIIK
jgi:phosphate transport system substrate-binding protein